MADRPEQANTDEPLNFPAADRQDAGELRTDPARGDWQGYDLTILSAVLDA
jgi:hypothetical protein